MWVTGQTRRPCHHVGNVVSWGSSTIGILYPKGNSAQIYAFSEFSAILLGNDEISKDNFLHGNSHENMPSRDTQTVAPRFTWHVLGRVKWSRVPLDLAILDILHRYNIQMLAYSTTCMVPLMRRVKEPFSADATW